ncbi:putative endo-1,3(4)-beta-glucanase [Stachybotrys elegans]|uniref:Endo-1,3(4)-beta-glucanase n=1 Tax=Stachybotrys elegans TaxID=80388 RepID=A0A8K0S9U7_9HYPO|nr:putative endo-1,3(4)-beta-glucanase [Stachybotrys elegans]
MNLSSLVLALSIATSAAWQPPDYPGYELVWYDGFFGEGGSFPASEIWNIIDGDLGVNNETQVYKTSTRNVQLSGGQTLQLIPWLDSDVPRGWTSGRMESTYTVAPQPMELTRVESRLRFGSNPIVTQQGLWPAFWMLGASYRSGVPWPLCGEIDIMENVNGNMEGFGTVQLPDSFLGAAVALPDRDWHTWRVEIDRRPNDVLDESIIWFLDEEEYHRVRARDIGNLDTWSRLAHLPMFLIVNMAVGGNWPGNPSTTTLDGYGSMVEFGYVAHYLSRDPLNELDII